MSGYCVVEWLPQTVTFFTAAFAAPALCATCAMVRLWSSRIIAVKFAGERPGALFIAISALVLAGLPTTSTLTLRFATASSAAPWAVKIAPLAVEQIVAFHPRTARARTDQQCDSPRP